MAKKTGRSKGQKRTSSPKRTGAGARAAKRSSARAKRGGASSKRTAKGARKTRSAKPVKRTAGRKKTAAPARRTAKKSGEKACGGQNHAADDAEIPNQSGALRSGRRVRGKAGPDGRVSWIRRPKPDGA